MDASHRQEVYIPEDAQVGSIPLWTIPDRLLDRMGVPTRPSSNHNASSSSSSSSSSSCAPTPSPEGTWISPVRIRKRTHLPAVCGDPDGDPCARRRTHGSPVEVPFVTSNRLALEVLQDLLQGTRSPHPTGGPPSGGRRTLPRVAAPPLHQDAVIAYRGNIFLSIRRSHRRGRGGGPRVAPPTPAPPSPAPPALGPVSTVPDSPPASTGEPHRTQRTPRPPGGLHLPEDPSAPHPDPEDPSAPHPDPEDPAPPHPDPEDPAPPHPEDPAPPHPEDPAPPHPEDPAPPHPDPVDPAPPHPEDPAPPHPDPIDPSAPHPEDPAPPHPDPEEESEGVPSETTSTPNTDHPEASSGPLLGVQDQLVPLHRGGPGPAQQNYRTCDFEALELDEKIARMKVKLRESEAALRRGCS